MIRFKTTMTSSAAKTFFFHSPKAGGTTIKNFLASSYPAHTHAPLIENNPLQHGAHKGDYGAYRGYDHYAGHYGRDIFEAVLDGHIAFANFRHPVARVVSLYNFFKLAVALAPEQLETEEFFAVKAAKTLPLLEFAASTDPRIDVYIRNQFVRQLTTSCWSNSDNLSLDEAKAFVDRMPWFYVCEYPELSYRWAKEALGWTLRDEPVANVTPQTPETVKLDALEPEIWCAIEDKNQLDLALYRHALCRLLDVGRTPRETW